MASNNQGIVHLRLGGWARHVIACKRRDSRMSVPAELFDAEVRKCKRCEAKWAKMQAIKMQAIKRKDP